MNKTLQIGLLGCGTIGSALAEELLSGRIEALQLKKVLVKDLSKKRNISAQYLTGNPAEVLEDPEIDIVIEVMGIENPALEYVLKALKAKKHLVTANKELIAKHGPKIFAEAAANKVLVRLDATVAGGIPIINTLLDSLKANHITSVVGILNGTTNYILSEMKRGKEFAAALTEAQAKGYAEPDPTNDVDGIDAKYKTAILASLAFQKYIAPEKVSTVGIKAITAADFRFALELGFSIKLLGVAKQKEGGHISAGVNPFLIPLSQPLAQIDGVLNAVQVRGDLIKELLLVGPGAGPKPTSSAVLGDALAIAKQGMVGAWPIPYEVTDAGPAAGDSYRFYVHLRVKDQIGVIRDLGALLANNNISLESITQKAYTPESPIEDGGEATLILLTHKITENQLKKGVNEINNLSQVQNICCILPVFE
jgi:homoserine dehydrogenase